MRWAVERGQKLGRQRLTTVRRQAPRIGAGQVREIRLKLVVRRTRAERRGGHQFHPHVDVLAVGQLAERVAELDVEVGDLTRGGL